MISIVAQKHYPDIVCTRAEAVTLDAPILESTVAVMCTGSGNITALFRCSSVAVIMAMTAGVEYRWNLQQINTAGTTATGLVILRW